MATCWTATVRTNHGSWDVYKMKWCHVVPLIWIFSSAHDTAISQSSEILFQVFIQQWLDVDKKKSLFGVRMNARAHDNKISADFVISIQITETWILFIRHLPLYMATPSIKERKIVTAYIIQKQNTNLRKKILLCCLNKRHVRCTHA
jgi:hypothetical protein